MAVAYIALIFSLVAMGLSGYNFIKGWKRPKIKGNTITNEKGDKVYAERFDS